MTEFPIGAKGDADMAGFVAAFAASTATLATFATAAGAAALAGAGLVAVALVPAVAAAADFQEEMLKLNTLVGISTELMGEFEESILDLAPGLGQTPQELAKAMFAITSGGIRSAESVDLLVASAQAARIGLGDVTTIARVSTATLQAFADQSLTASQAVDIMVGTVREGNLVAAELPNAFGRVIGIAGQMGVTFQEVGTFIATFTRLGVSAEIAATSLRSTLFALLNPGKEARDTFDSLGISVQEMRDNIREDGLTDAMLDLLAATDGNLDILSDIIPNIRAMSGVLGVYAAQADQVVEIQENMNNIFGVTAEGFETVQSSVKNSVAELKAGIATIAVTIGRFFLPPTQEMIDTLVKLSEVMNKVADVSLTFASEAGEAFGDLADSVFGTTNDIEELAESVSKFKEAADNAAPEVLIAALKRIREQQEEIGQMQIDQEGDPTDLNNRVNLLHAQAEILTEILDKTNLITQLEGFTVEVQGEDIDAIDKLLERLENKLLIEKGLERQILINSLAEAHATEANKERALALFDEIRALEEEAEAEKENAKIKIKITRSTQQVLERISRDGLRIRRRMFNDRRREEERNADILADLAIDKINRSVERQQDIAREVTRSIANPFEDLIRSLGDVSVEFDQFGRRVRLTEQEIFEQTDEITEKIAVAFRDMVTNILAEFARLKLEEALIGFLGNILIPIPNAPGAIPFPSDPTIGLDLPNLSPQSLSVGRGGLGGGATTIVNQTINFSPNLIDGRSGQVFIRENAGEIARIVGESVQTSGDFAAALLR